MSALYYYRHIIGDYDRDTKGLSLLEHGVYRRLMDAYYGNRGPILADPANLYRVTSAILPDEQAAVRKIAYLYFDVERGYLHNEKCDEEIARVLRESDAQKKRAEKRWPKPAADAGEHTGADAGADAGASPGEKPKSLTGKKSPAEGKAETGEPKAESAGKDAGASPPVKPEDMPSHSHSHEEATAKERGTLPTEAGAPRFIPPSVADVRAYCTDRGNTVSPERFHAFYASKGWMVGRNKMKDWQAAVRTWEQRDSADKGKRAATEARNSNVADAWADAQEA